MIPAAYRLLLLSNSTTAGQPFLNWPGPHIRRHFRGIRTPLLFIPFAGVTISWDDYFHRVRDRFAEWGRQVVSIHLKNDPVRAILEAGGLIVGGGNTFQLTQKLQELSLIEPIRERVGQGAPYLGWSAGSNVACPTMKTTNDMPIVEPKSFATLNLLPFQLNVHYTEKSIPNHGGETRADRLNEFTAANQGTTVLGLREETGLLVENGKIELLGEKPAELFRFGHPCQTLEPGSISLKFL